MLTATELETARADAARALPDYATIKPLEIVSDFGGGRTETWGTGGTVPARIGPVGGGERAGGPGARIDDRTTHIITLPASTEITSSDRLNVGGTEYEVTAVRTRSWEITRRVEVREL
jgi:head-tail adaptor